MTAAKDLPVLGGIFYDEYVADIHGEIRFPTEGGLRIIQKLRPGSTLTVPRAELAEYFHAAPDTPIFWIEEDGRAWRLAQRNGILGKIRDPARDRQGAPP